MQHKLLKTMLLALLVWAAVPTLTAQVAHVGDILCEGNAIISPANYPSSGATAIGVVFYVDNTGQHGWAVALEDAGSYQWCNIGGGQNTPLPDYTVKRQAIYDFDGYQNTQIVRQNGSSTNYAAFYAVDFENGWYVPAIGQLNYLYSNLVEVNASLQVAGGSLFPTTEWRYWSSTESSTTHAWNLGFSGELHYTYSNSGNQKYHSWRVRGVRNF